MNPQAPIRLPMSHMPFTTLSNIHINSGEDQSLKLQDSFQVFVEIGDGRTDTIVVTQGMDSKHEAQKFCKKHRLEEYIVDLLAQSLEEQTKREKQYSKNLRQSRSLVPKHELSRQNSKSKVYQVKRNSQELWRQAEQKFDPHPKVNKISEEIVRKAGKQNIIQSRNRKSIQKTQKQIRQLLQMQQKQLQGCSFHPSINPISRKVDETINMSRKNSKQKVSRYKDLYQDHKRTEEKKQTKRRNSITQMNFKPNINKLSKNIMDRKRSIDDLWRISVQKNKIIQKKKEQQQKIMVKLNKQKKQLRANTQNLCLALHEQAKRRKQKLQKEADRIYGNQNNWKIIQNSQNLVHNLRENKIKQIFFKLSKPPHKFIHYKHINLSALSESEKILTPLFDQMKQIDEELTLQQFVEAGLRLIKYISPNQRTVLTRKSVPQIQQLEKQKQNLTLQLNRKSMDIVKAKGYCEQNIYMRGLMFKHEVKNQIQKQKQQKVRKQLKICTFKPKIHRVPHQF